MCYNLSGFFTDHFKETSMPSPGMVIDMIIEERIKAAIEKEFTDLKEREDAWKYFKLAYSNLSSIFMMSAGLTGIISFCFLVGCFVSWFVFQAIEVAATSFGFAILFFVFAACSLGLSDYLSKRSASKLKALLDSDPVRWSYIQNKLRDIWLDAGKNIYCLGRECAPQTKVEMREGGAILLIRIP